MTKSPDYCPVCYTDLRKIKKQNIKDKPFVFKIAKQCPQCKTWINCDKDCSLVRCDKCLRLFTDVLTYQQHLDKNYNCNMIIPVKVIRG